MNTSKNITIGVLQSDSVSCPNRDSNNDQKTAEIGGATRSIVSSQCQKRAQTEYCRQYLGMGDRMAALRTRSWNLNLIKLLVENGFEDKFAKTIAQKFAENLGSTAASKEDDESEEIPKTKGKGSKKQEEEPAEVEDKKKVGALLFSPLELSIIAKRAAAFADENPAPDTKDQGKWLTAMFKAIMKNFDNIYEILSQDGMNTALFGRMIAGDGGKALRVDAAVSTMFAYTVHPIEEQYDYFTAVDEVAEESGAAMIGNTSFTSGTYYRCQNINLSLLEKVPANIRKEVVAAMIESFIKTHSGARQNAMFSTIPPFYVLGTYSEGELPWQSGAFINPIPLDHDNIEGEAVRRIREDFADYKKRIFTGKKLDSFELAKDSKLTIKQFIEELVKYA